MGLGLFSFIQNHWPFFPKKLNDLALSDQLVKNLAIPEHTKKFVYAIVEPESQSIVYILSAQNLSKQSALDAEFLIKEVRPDVVVTQVAPSSLAEIRTEEKINKRIGEGEDEVHSFVPTSWFGVLKGCFVDKINKEKYESLAGSVLLKEIFGVGLHGHFFAAKRAAEEVGSSVFFIESPFVSTCADECNDSNPSAESGKNKLQSSSLSSSNLVPQSVSSGVSLKQLVSNGDLPTDIVKLLVSVLSQFNQKPSLASSVSDAKSSDYLPQNDYEVPSFAQTVYPLLIDLHSVFGNLPSIETALAHARRMFYSVDKGESVDIKLLSEVQTFQIAVEGLRIGMNSVGRSPLTKSEKSTTFAELSTEDKSYALFAQAIRSQTQKFKSVVAVVDANSLSGLRKHWNTNLPPDVKELINQFISQYEDEENKNLDKKRLIHDKPVVAVGAGATAVLGASSLSKALPASLKLIPASFKFALVQSQKVMAIGLSKILGPAKLVAPGLTTTGAKSAVVMKATATSNKVRAITHSLRAYAQKTSISATRTAFYEIMKKRGYQPIGYTPWAKFGCSVSVCAGLLMYGDGVECAVESVPVAPAIASLGRGLRNLHEANEVVRQEGNMKIQEAIQSLMYRFKNNGTHNRGKS